MAKKKKYLEFKLSSDFVVNIDPLGRETLFNDIARGEVSLSLNYIVDDGVVSSFSAYPDRIEGGQMEFAKVSPDLLQVKISGSYFHFLDPKWDQDDIDMWKSITELKVYSNGISDSEPISHYINGSEELIVIGVVSLVEK